MRKPARRGVQVCLLVDAGPSEKHLESINNLRLAGNTTDFKGLAMSWHNTLSVLKRYNLLTEEELTGIRWYDEQRNPASMNTHVDTSQNKRGHGFPVTPWFFW